MVLGKGMKKSEKRRKWDLRIGIFLLELQA
jgi:hypothetical protein